MAKKAVQKKQVESAPPKPVKTKVQQWYADKTQLSVIVFILLATFMVYSPTLSSTKEFTNWDDPVYVVEQPIITALDAAHLKSIFTEPVSLNYHPVTMLSLALNYNFSQLHPFGYFLTNIIIHLLNTFLVFVFLYRLSDKKFWVGAVAALLFGLHPMHVESVAWISERKDLLYCFFFLTTCISYLRYVQTGKIKFVLLCFVLFVLSCLSKAMAAPLPVVLLLIDFYRQRKFTAGLLLEKLPFFVVSIAIGYAAVSIQSHGAIADSKVFTIPQRFMFASYGFMMYWVKMFVPINMSTFYPYPVLDQSGNFGIIYKVAILIALAIVAVPGYLFYKKDQAKFRVYIFGMGFFIAMVGMVLQFISVGKAIMADRYTYLPYIGAFFIFASFLSPYIENAKTKMTALALVLVVSCALAFTSYSRAQVWHDSGVLWSDVIAQFPYTTVQNGNVITVVRVGVDDAYKNRGNFYREHGDVDKAMADYEMLVRVHSQDEDAYSGLGNFYALKGNFERALELYSESLKMKPGKLDTYRNRAITYSRMGKHQEALDDLHTAVKLMPSAEATLEISEAYEELSLNQWDNVITDCGKILTTQPNNADALLYRGTAYVNLGKFNEAISDLSQAVKINPASGNTWFNLSYAYNQIGNKAQALNAAMSAQKNGYNVSPQYLQQLNAK